MATKVGRHFAFYLGLVSFYYFQSYHYEFILSISFLLMERQKTGNRGNIWEICTTISGPFPFQANKKVSKHQEYYFVLLQTSLGWLASVTSVHCHIKCKRCKQIYYLISDQPLIPRFPLLFTQVISTTISSRLGYICNIEVSEVWMQGISSVGHRKLDFPLNNKLIVYGSVKYWSQAACNYI